jgi:hypothetical protein
MGAAFASMAAVFNYCEKVAHQDPSFQKEWAKKTII